MKLKSCCLIPTTVKKKILILMWQDKYENSMKWVIFPTRKMRPELSPRISQGLLLPTWETRPVFLVTPVGSPADFWVPTVSSEPTSVKSRVGKKQVKSEGWTKRIRCLLTSSHIPTLKVSWWGPPFAIFSSPVGK